MTAAEQSLECPLLAGSGRPSLRSGAVIGSAKERLFHQPKAAEKH